MSINISDLTEQATLNSTDLFHIRGSVSGIGKKVTFANLVAAVKAEIDDDYFPIGMLYVQFPGKDSPVDMSWPGTWTNKSSDFAGEFFRAEGGEASVFESGQQSDALQGHYHDITVRKPSSGPSSMLIDQDSPVSTWAEDVSWAVKGPITDGSHGTPRTASETRPVNRTVRIWERTS